jgi:beta-galactosidase/beta-glucuronidase
MADKKKEGEAKGWAKPGFDDSSWKTTDVGSETWSTMDYHNYFGRMWYRTKVTIPAARDGKRTYFWLGSTDGSTKVFINGKPVPYVDLKGKKRETFDGFCRPASFNITGLFLPDRENTITLRCDRTALNEIGTGGLLNPAAIYRDRL